MTGPRWIDGEAIAASVTTRDARQAMLDALRTGLDPAADPPRMSPYAGNGQLLIMPSATSTAVGVKVLSVTPDNPARGLPRIQAWYVLMDAATLTPRALLDGTALTALRTPAHSMIGVDALAPADIDTVVFLGGGPQTVQHARALLDIRKPRTAIVHDVDPARGETAASDLRRLGYHADAVQPDGLAEAIRAADLIVCCTSAAEPLFDGSLVRDGACVVAIGSHEPDRRELDAHLMGRAQVVVEDAATALREAGDVVQAVAAGTLDPSALRAVAEVAAGRVQRATDRPNVFKTVGMAWQDLIVAELAAG